MTAIIRPADAAAIDEAARRLRAGELVAFPTETVYGLGANALDSAAVLRIFEAKGRPADNPLIAHIHEEAQLGDVARAVPECAPPLMAAFWPGPLTLVMPRAAGISDAVTAGLDTVAVRMPNHPVARDLLRACGFPVAAPSANRSGRPSPTTAEHVFRDIGERIGLILDGGPCPIGLESTVVDVSHGTPVLLRPGGVTLEMLRGVVPETRLGNGVMEPLGADEAALSPGLKHRHYAPRAKLTLFSGEAGAVARRICAVYDAHVARGEKAAILCASENARRYGADRCVWPLDGGMGADVNSGVSERAAVNGHVGANGEPGVGGYVDVSGYAGVTGGPSTGGYVGVSERAGVNGHAGVAGGPGVDGYVDANGYAGANVHAAHDTALAGAAHALFGALRALDDRGVTAILCETWPTEGLGLAVMNRLSRAAAFEIVEVDAP